MTRYSKQQQGQPIQQRHTRHASSGQLQMSRSLGSDSAAMFACANADDQYRQNANDRAYAYQQQFATLSRGRPDQLGAQAIAYSDYTKLTGKVVLFAF